MDHSIELQLMPDVLAAQQGDMAAYQRLIKRCAQMVSSIALAIVKDLDRSEDVAQQVFIHVWQQLPQLREASSFLPWVRQITRYQAFHGLRDQKARRELDGDDAETVLAEFIDPDACPELWHGRAEQSQLLQQFLDALPAESREMLLLFYREEQSSSQVAALLGISEANVRKKLQRVRESLKEQWLSRYGQLILSTAPGLGFSAALTAALATASPPAAAMAADQLAHSVAPGAASGPLKFLALLGGAAIGALLAIAAVFYGMKPAIDRADSAELATQLRQLRRRTMAWMALFGLCWVAAYELTTSAWGPIACMTMLTVLLLSTQVQLSRLLAPQQARERLADPKAAAKQRRQWLGCAIGTVVGIGAGWAGMIAGLIASGRL
ncbi:sigma-70 family RNA polymerase sigma factor [Rheinheimera texasensis]|uniref:RNA polymerase sigma factor n=1 Tax=Rheinheimera texasensis TaxID=306205 RepID=UPI0032B2D3FE